MGLFDKLKKSKQNGEEKKSNVGNTKETAMQSVAYNAERCTLVVEDTFLLKENQGVVVVGFLHGKLAVGDAVYLIQPNGQTMQVPVRAIEVNQGVTAQSAENQPIAIHFFEIKDKAEIQKYTVVTSIRPQETIDGKQAVENVQMLGLSMEFQRFKDAPGFMPLLIFVMCHSSFITPVYVDKMPQNNGDGTATFAGDSTMSFRTLPNPANKAERYLPIFTDLDAMNRWKNCFTEGQVPKTMILRFRDVVAFTKESMDGAVINPFGPMPISLSRDYIANITELEGYQAEFGKQ